MKAKTFLLGTILGVAVCTSCAQASSLFTELVPYAKPLGRVLVRSFASSSVIWEPPVFHRPEAVASTKGFPTARLFSSRVTEREIPRPFVERDDFWRGVYKVAISDLPKDVGASPLLKITDTWRSIAEITKRYCATTATTIDKKLEEPAKWMQELGDNIANIEGAGDPSLFYSRVFREKFQTTSYIWEDALKKVFKDGGIPRLEKQQAIALLNLKLISEKVFLDVDAVKALDIYE